MKALKKSLIVFFAVGFFISFSKISFADRDHEDMKALKEAASALEQMHPGLSTNLTKIIERKEWEQKGEGSREEQMIKLYRDAAAALEETHFGLEEGFRKLATRLNLAEGLTKLANEELQETRGHKEEGEIKSEKKIEEKALTNLLLLKEAAATLQESHSTLAEGLAKIASQKIQLMDEEDTEEVSHNKEKSN